MTKIIRVFILTAVSAAMALAAAAKGLDCFNVTTSPASLPAGRVVSVQVVSSVADGTATLKSVSTLPVIENVDVVTFFTNFTYSSNFTSNGVHQVVTNMTVRAVTNAVPTATSVVVVTNSLCPGLTCSGGYAASFPTNAFIYPGDPIFFDGTASGRVRVIIER